MITFQIDGTRYYINQDKRIEEVWLFGSYARGDYKADSDIDIMILLELSDIQDITGEYIDTDNEYMYYYSAEFVK